MDKYTFFLLATALATSAIAKTDSICHVDPKNVEDSNPDGTKEHPFPTISKALSFIKDNSAEYSTISLANGEYETEPLTIDNHTTIKGESQGKAIIKFTGTQYSTEAEKYANIVIKYGQLKNITIHPNSQGVGIIINGTALMHKVIFGNSEAKTNPTIGILTTPNSTLTITSSKIHSIKSSQTDEGQTHNNPSIGLRADESSTITISNTLFENNDIGIKALGGSTLNISPPQKANTFSDNSHCNILYTGPWVINAYGSIFKQSNKPNKTSFITGTNCQNGRLAATADTGTITAKPTTLKTPIFDNSTEISTISPSYNSILYKKRPRISWIPTHNKATLAAIFKNPPIIENNKIKNTADVVWLWHSGLEAGFDGNVIFSQGVTPSAKDPTLTQTGRPVPLTPGNSYYFATWSWSENGMEISESSAAIPFHIHPTAN